VLSGVFGKPVDDLTRGLSYAARRHTLLAGNVANVETPGYVARDLVFDDYLRPSVAPTPADFPAELLPPGPDGRALRLVQAVDGPARPDGNDVRLDRQMARLAGNTLYQNTLVQLLTNHFNTLKQAISGRV
jgi:flagellar basal-body rod protein FlgB